MTTALPHKPGLFPLWVRKGGTNGRPRWCKKVNGKLCYFGYVEDDPTGDKALALWVEQREDLKTGRRPKDQNATDDITLLELCDRFLVAKRQKVNGGELSPRTWDNYKRNGDRIIKQFGRNRRVATLGPNDFASLYSDATKTCGPIGLKTIILLTRVLFKYAFKNELIAKPVNYGDVFELPSRKTERLARAAKGERVFEGADIRRMLKAANARTRAMIYLGSNCGFANGDCVQIEMKHLDLERGWIKFPRPKTGINRRVPLWPETVAALRSWLAVRPEPASLEGKDRVFLTKHGLPLGKATSPNNPISNEFGDFLDGLGLHGDGLNFYALRHTFRTIADETRDQVAVDSIMGHADGTKGGRYRERIGDDRLQAVVDHVRTWLLPKPAKAKQPAKRKSKPKKQKPEVQALRVVG